MLHQLLNGRFMGHPIHPMLVHFPSALFSISLVFDAAGLYLAKESFFTASIYCIGAGLTGGLLAGLFGFIDYVKLTNRETVFQKASWHAIIQFSVLIIFGIIFGFRYQTLQESAAPCIWQLVASTVGVLMMLTGNYLGGDLVFRDGVGVSNDPSDRSKRSDG